MDDALDLLELLMTELQRDAENAGQKERIRTLRGGVKSIPSYIDTK